MTLKGHQGDISSLDVNFKNKTLISCDHNGEIILWDLVNGVRKGNWINQNCDQVIGQVYGIKFIPNSTNFISISGDDSLRIYDYMSGQLISYCFGGFK